jgi:leucyl/phenylalanyl-tRNA--protein transferase
MAITTFPPLEDADEDGLLALGGDLEVASLLLAYRSGIFPWPISRSMLAWFSPPQRAVLFLKDFHCPRSLRRTRRDPYWRCTLSQSFSSVIQGCADSRNRKGQRGTWITPQLVAAYESLFSAGYAYSVETWYREELVGGLYGVMLDGWYTAESMYYTAPNASKIALAYLVELLVAEGKTWLDCQVLNPFTASFGVREIPRSEFLSLMSHSRIAQ